jgi:hypothetical protein
VLSLKNSAISPAKVPTVTLKENIMDYVLHNPTIDVKYYHKGYYKKEREYDIPPNHV